MTNTLPGDWTLLVARSPGTVRHVEDRVREFDKLGRVDQHDVVRGILLLLEELAKADDLTAEVRTLANYAAGLIDLNESGRIPFGPLREAMVAL